MRTAILVILLASVSWSLCAQESFSADAISTGTTVIWFYGTSVETTFDGILEMAGALRIDDEPLSFTATGPSYGSGIGDSSTLAVTLWVVFEAEGTLDSGGEQIILRGGMHVLGEEADLTTLSLGAGTGTFFLIANVLDTTVWISGTLTTTASGAFVPADDPTTMQIKGTGTFAFEGAQLEITEELIEVLPWDPTTWPLEQHQALLSLLLGAEPEDGEESSN
jgi:hypothetical protein